MTDLLREIDSLMVGDPQPTSDRGLALLLLATIQERTELKARLSTLERLVVAFTRQWDEHPEAWGDLPCECGLCRSYGE